MRFIDYLKDRLYQVILITMVVLLIEIQLYFRWNNIGFEICMMLCAYGCYFIISLIQFYKEKNYFAKINRMLNNMDRKYLIFEMLEESNVQEEKQFQEILYQCGKQMIEHVNDYKRMQQEYVEYIEMWVHEIKYPIATGKMLIENNRNEILESIEDELVLIEGYTEQALYYARSNYVEKDYIINKVYLKEIVNKIMIYNKKNLIMKKVKLILHDLDSPVYSDGKWMYFILNQIIANSIKYSDKPFLELEIYQEECTEGTCLHIKDNGMGIPSLDIDRVFDKGFTGTNGRKGKRSTGIGLYLCKKLCNKMHHGIRITSEEGNGCCVSIVFPKGSYASIINELPTLQN